VKTNGNWITKHWLAKGSRHTQHPCSVCRSQKGSSLMIILFTNLDWISFTGKLDVWNCDRKNK